MKLTKQQYIDRQKYINELRLRLDMIFDNASDHVQDYESNDELPEIDKLIEMTIEMIKEMESDIGNVKPKDR